MFDADDIAEMHALETAMCASGMDDRHVSDLSSDLLLDTIDVMRADPENFGPVPLDMATEAFSRGHFLRL